MAYCNRSDGAGFLLPSFGPFSGDLAGFVVFMIHLSSGLRSAAKSKIRKNLLFLKNFSNYFW